MEGLGDLVAKVTEVTGIKAVVDAIAPEGGCGCQERQAKLNQLFPFGSPTIRPDGPIMPPDENTKLD
jgi:hypothetical protein